MTRNKFAPVLLALACSALAAGRPSLATEAPTPPCKWVETETLVGTLPSNHSPYLVSPDQRRVAFQVDEGERTYVELDGKKYYAADFSTLNFSPDGQRLAYVVRDARGVCLAVDGKEERPYKSLRGFTFSPDGKSWAYVGQTFAPCDPATFPSAEPCFLGGGSKTKPKEPDAWSCLVVNGKEGPRFGDLTAFVCSPDWTRQACVVRWKGGVTLVVDGRPALACRALEENSIVFSPDGKRFACVASDGERNYVVVDGKEGPKYRSKPSIPVFSPDGQRFAYWVKEGDFVSVIVDGEPGFKGAGEVRGGVRFSPDSRHWAVELGGDGTSRVVADGTEHKAYRRILNNSLAFLRDGRLCYLGDDGHGVFDCADGVERNRGQAVSSLTYSPAFDSQAYFLDGGNGKHLVLNGTELPLRDSPRLDTLSFTCDGRHYAFVSYRNPNEPRREYVNDVSRQYLVVDGVKGDVHDYICPESVTFSPDGGRVACFVKDHDRLRLSCGSVSVPVDEASGRRSISFSPDGKHLAYRPASPCVVVDNRKGGQYDEVFPKDGRILFDTSDCFHYLARRLNNFYLVEARCVPEGAAE